MTPKNMELIKKLITTEVNGYAIVEIAKHCQSELDRRNKGLASLFE